MTQSQPALLGVGAEPGTDRAALRNGEPKQGRVTGTALLRPRPGYVAGDRAPCPSGSRRPPSPPFPPPVLTCPLSICPLTASRKTPGLPAPAMAPGWACPVAMGGPRSSRCHGYGRRGGGDTLPRRTALRGAPVPSGL